MKNTYLIVEVHSKKFDIVRQSVGNMNKLYSIASCSNQTKAEEVVNLLNFAEAALSSKKLDRTKIVKKKITIMTEDYEDLLK